MTIQLRKGDVIRNAGQEWAVDLVNESRARCVALFTVAREGKTRFDKQWKSAVRPAPISISRFLEADQIVRKVSVSELNQITKTSNMKNNTNKTSKTTKAASSSKPSSKRKNGNGTSKQDIAPVTQEAASAVQETPAAAESKTEAAADKGRGKLGGLLGYSVAAVCRTLGKAGLKARQVQGLMDSLSIKVNPHTVHIQTGAGRRGNTSYGAPAPLTQAQLDELISKVPAEAVAAN